MSFSTSSPLQPVHWLKIGFDLTSCFLLFIFFQSLKIFATPFKSSFYCNDYSINMPFKRSTVTNGNLILIGVVFPFVLLAATELVRSLYVRRFPSPATATRFVYKIRCLDRRVLDVTEQFGNLYVNCGAFFFGLASVACITDFVKVVVGRLRPNFLDVCQPNLDPYKLVFYYNIYVLVN
jgi:phosphatidate phosphatase